MKLTRVAVVTVPERQDRALAIQRIIPEVAIVNRPEYPLSEAHWEAWELVSRDDALWGLVLQDDILLCDDFPRKAAARLSEAHTNGYRAVTFYSPRQEDVEAKERGARWIERRPQDWLNEQALAIRPGIARAYLKWARETYRKFDPDRKWHDYLLQRFLKNHGINVAVTVPSLVQHDLSLPSLTGHPPSVGGKRRESKTWSKDAA